MAVRWELDWLENRARLTPDAMALIDAEENTSRTFAELNSRSKATANWLYEKGVRKGD